MIKKTYLTLIIICLSFLVSFNFAKADICPFNQSLKYGDDNSIVKELQNFLSLDKDVYSGPVTGYFGNQTKEAVKAFQKKTGLLPNGEVDLATATVLCQIYVAYKSSETISNDNLDVNSSCFLKTMNLSAGYYDEATEEVLLLQKWLADKGYYPEKQFTGYFGPLTKKAVQRFQKAQGIIQTGTVGVKTTAAICGNISSQTTGYDLTNSDLIISGVEINPLQINVGTKVKVRFKEQNISNVLAGKHTSSLFINEEEVSNKNIPELSSGEEALSADYTWTCEKEGIYVFKLFVDNTNKLVESNKYNNILVFPVNCGGVANDFKYACNNKTGECEIDPSGSMSLEECSQSCSIGDSSLPDLYIKSFSPTKIQLGETLPLIITEKNGGNAKVGKHKYIIDVEFNGQSKKQDALFGELGPNSEQQAKGNWECKAPGIYTVTINVDPDNDIKESNESNNIKSFKIQCADKDGNIPKEEGSDDTEDNGGDDNQDRHSDSGNEPDIDVSLTPIKLNNGSNDVKISLVNLGNSDISATFNILVSIVYANGEKKEAKNPVSGLRRGNINGISGSLFTEPVSCDPKSPFEITVKADSDNVIKESNESNNVAKVTCGDTGSGSGGGDDGGGGDKTPPENDDDVICYSDPKGGAKLEISSAQVLSLKNDEGDLPAKRIVYTLKGLNAERASNIKVTLKEGANVLQTQSISSVYGCKTTGGYFNYVCTSGGPKNFTLEVKYFGVTWKTVSETIKADCNVNTGGTGIPYCEINKAIASDGTIRLQEGEMVEFKVYNVAENTETEWTGSFDKKIGAKAYKTFSTTGRYTISGVSAKIQGTTFKCPSFTAIVVSSGGSESEKVKLNGYCSVNPSNISMSDNSSPYSQVCLTPYISDLNSKCSNISYNIVIKVNGTELRNENRSDSNKTVCLEYQEIKGKLPKEEGKIISGVYSIEATVEAKCSYDGEDYYLTKTCSSSINYGSGSTSSSGSLSGSCSVSPSSPLVGYSANFSASVSKSGFSSGKCSSLKYSWSGCSSSSSSCSKTYNSSGDKSDVNVTVSCSDDSSKSVKIKCPVTIREKSSSTPPPIGEGSFGATCSCDDSGCHVNITGESTNYLDYSCTWYVNGVKKDYVSTCKGINPSNFLFGSVTVVEDDTGKKVTVDCSRNDK